MDTRDNYKNILGIVKGLISMIKGILHWMALLQRLFRSRFTSNNNEKVY